MRVGSGHGQLRALLALRWGMVRGRGARVRLGAAVAAALGAPVLGVLAAGVVDDRFADQTFLLLPTAFLGFAAFTVAALLSAGGGAELVPSRELVAFPVSPRTVFMSSLLLVPTNLAWYVQVLTLLTLVAYSTSVSDIAGAGLTASAVALSTGYVAATTVLGAALSWLVLRLRGGRGGRGVLWALAGAVLALVLWLRVTGRLTAVLDRAPTRGLVITVLLPAGGRWWLSLGVLAVLAALGLRSGGRAAGWATFQASDLVAEQEARHVPRRRWETDPLTALLFTDLGAVWRSRPVRRGVLLLSLLPGTAMAFSGIGWDQAVLLPGLLTAGTALLFGVNAFSLDGGGATWLESSPVDPRLRLQAKGITVAGVSMLATLPALVGVTIGSGRAPTLVEAIVMGSAVVANTALVTSQSLKWSLAHPYGVQLRGARDVPAPPGAMVGYSTRLALGTTGISILLYLTAQLEAAPAAIVVAVCAVLVAAIRLTRTFGRWADSAVRAQVTLSIASG